MKRAVVLLRYVVPQRLRTLNQMSIMADQDALTAFLLTAYAERFKNTTLRTLLIFSDGFTHRITGLMPVNAKALGSRFAPTQYARLMLPNRIRPVI